MMKHIKNSFYKLQHYIEEEGFIGYDPYDTLLSWIPFKKFGKWIPVLAIQFQKRNPVNIRPLLGIGKGYNPKAMGLMLHAYSDLFKKTHKKEYKEKADDLFEWLKNNATKHYSGYCWGYNFPWASPVKYLPPFTPSSVVTGFVIRGVWEYYSIEQNSEAKSIIESAGDFILHDIPFSHDKNGICISYTPVMRDLCFNASLLGAEILARKYMLCHDKKLKESAIDAVNWVLSHQKTDGKWNYSIDPDTFKQRNQIDFHQGYVIESIHEIKKLLEVDEKKWDKAIEKGLNFYYTNQFYKNGQSLWRLPKVYPIDIHNQAQGIITFYKLSSYRTEYFNFAHKIADYTIRHMQSSQGYFYYKINKWYKHKIPYMRWSQAWMFLALSKFI